MELHQKRLISWLIARSYTVGCGTNAAAERHSSSVAAAVRLPAPLEAFDEAADGRILVAT
jgi:hypothetical protein